MEQPIWQPSAERIERSNVTAFVSAVAQDWGPRLGDFGALYEWSVAEPEKFWHSLWDFAGVIAETRGNLVVEDMDKLPGARFFPNARLNYAENLLRRRDDGAAMVFWGEDRVRRRLTWAELYDLVSRLRQALDAAGIRQGDRVAGFMPNLPETMAVMLATASLGAIWSSCSPDFGVQGVLDRFGQIEPKILFTADGYYYNGKRHDSLAKARLVLAQLPSVATVVVASYAGDEAPLDGLGSALALDDFIAPFEARHIAFAQLPFNHPLFILYSSGTTGAPKCIVHGAGGTLLQHLKEQRLHADLKAGERLFYFTTCGWMMWNWLASGLASEATLLLYDGSPFHPDGNVLFDFAEAEGMNVFGTSAKYIDAIAKAGLEPRASHDLSSLRTMLSTGSPLAPQGFDYVYEKVKPDLHLASMSGGTDLIGCFVGGNPTGPVWRGEIQARALAMKVEVYDDQGHAIQGAPGELVCSNAFPSMPIGFWNDPGQVKYKAAYFEHYPGVWRHGDWVELTPHGGMVIYGRSDATLNPGGVRIGTAEIYRQVEQLDEVVEGLVIGQQWDNDTRVVLFVCLRHGLTLDEALVARIRKRIRDNTSPRHVPAKVIQVADIPRTINGKITELAVRDVIHGRPVKNREALANPEALELYKDMAELAT